MAVSLRRRKAAHLSIPDFQKGTDSAIRKTSCVNDAGAVKRTTWTPSRTIFWGIESSPAWTTGDALILLIPWQNVSEDAGFEEPSQVDSEIKAGTVFERFS